MDIDAEVLVGHMGAEMNALLQRALLAETRLEAALALIKEMEAAE